jgi:tetratricopeptide (TPR) repeat protein
MRKKLNFIFFIGLLAFAKNVVAQQREIDSIKQQIILAQKSENIFAEARNRQHLAEIQADNGSSFEALKNAQRAIEIFEKLGKKTELYQTYISIATVHQQLHNGDKILEYVLPALEYAKQNKDTTLIIMMLTAAGIGYDEKKDYATAASYYMTCAEMEKVKGLSPAMSYMNASSSYTPLGNYVEGRRCAELAIAQGIIDKDTTLLHYAYGNKAFACILGKQLDLAAAAMQQAEDTHLGDEDINANRDMFWLRSIFSATKGDYKNAYLQLKSFYTIDSTMSSEQRNAQFGELETVYETKRKEAENIKLNDALFRQKLVTWSILGLLMLLGIIIFLQRNRLIIKDKLLKTEKELATKEKEFHESELNNFTQSLREKNNIIENLKNDIEKRAKTDNSIEPSISKESEKDAFLTQLTQETILTEEQWRGFRQKFERVHRGFFQKFTQAVPEATESELRLAALTKLEMTNNEIAAMLGISPESVTKTRYRLRKKIGKEDGLEAVLKEIERK